MDSGETIELAVTIKNRWGKADPVTVTLSAQADGAVGPDPYVNWVLDKVDYGALVILVRMTTDLLEMQRDHHWRTKSISIYSKQPSSE